MDQDHLEQFIYGIFYLFTNYRYSRWSDEYYALKVINKDKVKSKSHKRYAIAEKIIFKLIEHQFIIKWYSWFETSTYL